MGQAVGGHGGQRKDSTAADRERLAELHGVATTYQPAPNAVVTVPGDTVVAVLAALGVDASTPHAVRDALAAHEHHRRQRRLPACVVVRAGHSSRLSLPAGTILRIETEQGDKQEWRTRPGEEPYTDPVAALPSGRHALRAQAPDGRTAAAQLVIAPDRLPAVRRRTYGFMAQLYSVLSHRSWGDG